MNFESTATIADGSCRYPGCTNEDADNFTATANFDDGTCVVGGCMNADAANYDAFATYDNGTCRFPGCTSTNALNYNPAANDDDGSCRFLFTAIEAIDLTGCPPLTFQVTNHNQIDSNTVCNYAINGTAVSQSCSGSFTYTLNESGFYELTYTIHVGNATADTTVYIEVLPTPNIPALSYNSVEQMIICSNCANEIYQWYFDGQMIESAVSSEISSALFGQTQNGTYTLEVYNVLGCGGYTTSIEILEPSLASNVTSGCVPLTVDFFNTTDTISSMICTLNSAITTIENFSGSGEITFEEPGIYTIELACAGTSSVSSVVLNIEAYDQFVPELSVDQINGVVSCTNCSNAQNIIWNIDGTIITGGTQQALGGDIYQIQASNASGCGGSDLLIVNETPQTELIANSIFPNPANDHLNISSSPEAQITVYDFTGKQVWSSSSKTSLHKLSVSSWAEGIYLVRIKSQEETFEKKILITH